MNIIQKIFGTHSQNELKRVISDRRCGYGTG